MIRQLIEAFERRDVEAVVALAHPDVEFHSVTGEVLGHNPYRGHDGLRSYFADEAQVWDELRISVEQMVPHDGQLIALGRVWARAGARLIDDSAGWIWRLTDGKVVYGRVFQSAARAREAAGLDDSD